jgi:hypothetical protein
MAYRLAGMFLSDYRRMELSTIGPRRFSGKLFVYLLKRVRRLQARVIPPRNWSTSRFLSDERPSMISGHWLFGANASMDAPEFAVLRERVLARAEGARQGIFEVNGRVVHLDSPPCNGRWDVDPISGKRWPQGSAFEPLGNTPGDVRFPWELDRLHHLVWFGQAWRYTQDPLWPETGISQLDRILKEAPFEHGIHWRDGLQLAVRIYSLVAFADLCHDAPAGIHSYLNNAIAGSAFALRRQISPDSEITNNHAIGESCALALASIYLQHEGDLERSLGRLRRELKRQLYPDGVPYEGTLPYIRFDLDFLSLLALAIKARGLQVPFWLANAITMIGRALAALVDSEGRVPPIGDGDDGRVLRLDEEAYLGVNESLHVASSIIGEPLAPTVASGSFALWAIGGNVLPATPPSRTRFLPDSGLIHLNRGALDIWLDCGPTGCGSTGPGGHGHNDTTAIVAHLNGVALLHDPGWCTYYGDRKMRDQLRKTAAHNTVRVDAHEQARLGGLFEILDDCKPTPVRIREFGTATAITCGHTGFGRLNKGVTYLRQVVIDGSGPWRIRVTDRVRSRVPARVESHLGSDLHWFAAGHDEWSLPGGHRFCLRSGGENLHAVPVPCSCKTGVLDEGTALEWRIPASTGADSSLGFSHVSRWEMEIRPV